MKSFVLAILNVVLPLFGVIVGGFVSNHSAVKQMKFESKRLRHQEKREAYSAFLSEYHKFLRIRCGRIACANCNPRKTQRAIHARYFSRPGERNSKSRGKI